MHAVDLRDKQIKALIHRRNPISAAQCIDEIEEELEQTQKKLGAALQESQSGLVGAKIIIRNQREELEAWVGKYEEQKNAQKTVVFWAGFFGALAGYAASFLLRTSDVNDF